MIDEVILNALNESFSTAVQRVEIPSLGRTLTFREPSVMEHRTLSKVVIANSDTQSVIYAATLAMIKRLCLEKDFDPHQMSEFDRLRTIVHLFSNNFFSKNLTIRCPHKACGGSLKYPVKYGTLLNMMDSVDCSDIVLENDSIAGKILLTTNFPNTMRYLSMLEAVDGESSGGGRATDERYDRMNDAFREMEDGGGGGSADAEAVRKIRKRRENLRNGVKKSVAEKTDILGNVDLKKVGPDSALLDIADIYIKRIQISNISGSDNSFDIDMSGFSYDDTEKMLASLPMALFVSDSGDLVKKMARTFFSRLNACVPKITCPKCGYEISKRLTLQSFFVFG